jgi:IclR family pca regulon transcriptional regulator
MSRTRLGAGYFSESLARGLLVIRAFDRVSPVLRISDVAKRTGLSRAAVRRYLLTLQDLGYVGSRNERFYLRPRILEIGFSYLSSAEVDRIVQPYLNELAEKTHETSSFAVLDRFDVLFVARAASRRVLNFSVSIGGRIPAYGTSIGHVLLAGLSPEEFEQYLADQASSSGGDDVVPNRDRLHETIQQVRSRGWEAIDGKGGGGLASVALPVRNQAGTVIAAVNIIQYPGHGSRRFLTKNYLPLLRESVDHIEAALEASGHFTGRPAL